VSGRIEVEAGGRTVECESSTLVTFAPGESRRVRALEPSRLLLVLAPWPGEGHFREGEEADPERMPANAAAPPLP
jgi:mannose-6-phosphate isomerase-like protein (cupin superfamily)